jgi:type II secretory ATPase GspE/PulE/Tfp pilus assembly ATPase PilB-like protein
MLSRADQVLAKALSGHKKIPRETFDALIAQAQAQGVSLCSLVVGQNLVPETECLRILADAMNLEMVDVHSGAIDKALLAKVPVKIATYYRFFPLKLQDRTLTIAVSYPPDVRTEDDIRMQLGYDVRVALAPERDIAALLKAHYGVGAETIGDILAQSPEMGAVTAGANLEERIEDLEKEAQDASVIKLVNQILLEATRRRATDIHLEPFRTKVRLRYRIDGVLYDVPVAAETKRFLSAILSRIKIMANLNIVEHRLAQDGRAVVKTSEQTIDLRVSCIPTPYGESVVIRILPTQMLFSLARLGLVGDQLEAFHGFVAKPHGVIFVTGPTGSGKTTTLYACLSEINTQERKIITIEDPIEYEMEGITQIQVLPDIGWTFARGLRSMLRHDPDVMMVGEVRDLETAEIAIRVALTGHLVFSTLHTNDAASGITRLIDIGVEPYLVASSVEAFVAQRLVRVLCASCKQEVPLDSDDAVLMAVRAEIARDLGLASVRDVKLFRGAGCTACNNTGFFGRTAIYEILTMDNLIRELVVKKAVSSQIKKIAVSRGMRTLRQDGWTKTIQGVTTFDEVVKVTQAEEGLPVPEASGPVATRMEDSAGAGHTVSSKQNGQRVFPRLAGRVNIRYKVFTSPDELAKKGYQPDILSATVNMSAGGILFFSGEPIPEGSFVELKLELPDQSEPVECLAKVVRLEEIDAGKRYNVAVQFLDITSAHRARVNKFVTDVM